MTQIRPALHRTRAPQRSVLVVIGEPTVQELVALTLRGAGLFAMRAGNGAEARRLAAEVQPDAVIVDVDGLGNNDPQNLAPQAPLLLLSASDNATRSRPGATWLRKPLAPREMLELLAQSWQRPHSRPPAARSAMRCGPLEVDGLHKLVRWRSPQGWRPIDLPEVERRLLHQLLTRPGGVHSRETIADGLWGDDAHDLRTVDQCVKRLRRSLLAAGAPECIKTVRGIGYRLMLDTKSPLPSTPPRSLK